MTLPLDRAQIESARALIDPAYLDTPFLQQSALDAALGCSLSLKIETLNPLRSFKGRGVEAKIASLSPKPGHVMTTSSGNFGQAVARAAARRGIRSTIFSGEDVNPAKLAAMRAFGAEVRQLPRDVDHKEIARQAARDAGAIFVEDGAHLEISAGAGTIGQEIAARVPALDIILVQIGDGALVTGVGSWIKAVSPQTRVIGVTAAGAPAMRDSVTAGHAITRPVDTIADGMSIGVPIATSVRNVASLVDEIVSVDDPTMLEAVALLLDRASLVAEPSGAAGVAAIMADPERFLGLKVAAILTGGNIRPDLWPKLPPLLRREPV